MIISLLNESDYQYIYIPTFAVVIVVVDVGEKRTKIFLYLQVLSTPLVN